MSEVEVTEGGCLCGAVRYRITGPVSPGAYCHCSMCRKSGGGPVSAWISAPQERFEFIGETAPAVYESSSEGRRRFCPKCGSQLTFESTGNPDTVAITVGTLDNPDAHPPHLHFWTSSAISWFHLKDDLPSFEKTPPIGGGKD